jgi:hypothetical protein
VRDQQILATERVRYVGDMVAAVAAIDDAVAAEAVKLIEVDYDELPAVYSVEEALADEAPLVHEKLENRKDPGYGRGGTHIVHERSNICFHFRHERGDVEQRFSRSRSDLRGQFLFSQRPALSDGAAHLRGAVRRRCAHRMERNPESVSGAPGTSAGLRLAVQRGARDCALRRRRLWRQERHQDRRHRCLLVAHDRTTGKARVWRRRNLQNNLPTARQDHAQNRA